MTKAGQIKKIWQMFEKLFPDKSTECLLELTAQEASRTLRHYYSCGDVSEALAQTKVFNEK